MPIGNMETCLKYIKCAKPAYHEDEMEIMVVLKGSIDVYKLERMVHLEEGDVTFINRNVVHYCVSDKGAHVLVSKINLRHFSYIFPDILYMDFICEQPSLEKKAIKRRIDNIVIDAVVQNYFNNFKEVQEEDEQFLEENLIFTLHSYYQLAKSLRKEEDYLTDDIIDRYYYISRYVWTHIHEKIMVEDVLKEVYINPTYFSQFMKKVGGVGFKEFVLYRKLMVVSCNLIETDDTMNEVAHNVGIGDMKTFYQMFKRFLNTTPNKWREEMLAMNNEMSVYEDQGLVREFVKNHHIDKHQDNQIAYIYKKLLVYQKKEISLTDIDIAVDLYGQLRDGSLEDYQVFKNVSLLIHKIREVKANLIIRFDYTYIENVDQFTLLKEFFAETLKVYKANEIKKWRFIIQAYNQYQLEQAVYLRSIIHQISTVYDINIELLEKEES